MNLNDETMTSSRSLALARRLERAEGSANAAFVDARHEVDPGLGATWIEVAGLYAMYDGPESPLTQTFGLGVFEPFLAPQFEQVEAFFSERGAPTAHEVCSYAAPATLDLLAERGYSPIEASVVLVRPTGTESGDGAGPITVRQITESEPALWARVAAQGWSSESPDLVTFIESFGTVSARARGVVCFLAELENEPVAAAALSVCTDIALLAGASTIPSARKRGAQGALLRARLEFAAARGRELAMIVTAPGSASQRNAERQGFRPVYSRTKWQRAAGSNEASFTRA